ncbi:MAG: hypothetical protein ACTS80_01525, partial [Candidatus Hodgkinia cicadicola]
MFLPQVIKSSRVMKTAVKALTPLLERKRERAPTWICLGNFIQIRSSLRKLSLDIIGYIHTHVYKGWILISSQWFIFDKTVFTGSLVTYYLIITYKYF